ncbi:class I adenylate-forming enzyme family protein [Mycobacterium sp. HUMS_1102779]|uniref:class I adenylate-forming enzyme family protein n=1 Tax=Mycobacterium sp. HUMS_1102779 TaxID=3383487 RepID=UPI00389A59B0
MVSDTTPSAGFDYAPLRDKWYRQGWYSTRTCIDALRDGAARHGQSSVVFVTEHAETTSTVAEIHRQALGVAAGLQRLGVAPGDAVAVQLTSRLECAIAYEAVLLCGAVLVPIIHIYGPHEVGFILAQSAAKVLITAAAFRSTSNLDRLENYARTAAHIVLVDAESGRGYLGWPTLTAPSGDYAEPSPSADDVCLLLYTSGTTSAPKGVRHSHNSLLAEQATVTDLIAGRPGDVQLVSFPPGHIAGVGSLLQPLMSGSRAVFVDGWDPARAADIVVRHRVTSTAGTPFHLEGLLALGDTAEKLASLREFLVGAATVTDEQGRRAAAAGITTFRCYGLTEHPTVTAGHPEEPDAARLGTDGTPMRGSSVRILGPDGTPVPTGRDGEVVVAGPDQFIGYHDPALNAAAFTPDGWFRTGDLGHLDADGRLNITDRIKDVIIRAGETISSGQVEEVLNAHPAVREGVAVAAPDPHYGDVVGAVVVLQPGAHLDLEEVRRHFAASGLARQKTPERLVIVESLPRTSLGKVRKADLRATHFGR